MKLRECENFWVLGLFLGMVGLISALVLALVSEVTAPAIARSGERSKSAALKQLNLPEFDNAPTKETIRVPGADGGVVFMAVRRSGKLVGLAAEASTRSGYAGEVRELVGFDRDGRILAVLVTDEKETPGLGKNVCERKFKRTIFNFFKPVPAGLPPNEILDQFTGRRAGDKTDWRVVKDGGEFTFRTGATVTSRAVTALTGDIAGALAKHRGKIFAAFEAQPEAEAVK